MLSYIQIFKKLNQIKLKFKKNLCVKKKKLQKDMKKFRIESLQSLRYKAIINLKKKKSKININIIEKAIKTKKVK